MERDNIVHGFILVDSRLHNGKSEWLAEQIKKSDAKRTQEVFDRVVERNGDALTRLAKEDEDG